MRYTEHRMRRLLRHSGSLGALTALLVVGLLQLSPVGHRLQAPLQSPSTPTPDSATPFPKKASGPSLAIPLWATVPAAPPKQARERHLESTTPSKGARSAAYDAAPPRVRALLARRLASSPLPLSRTHLFCVYRL